MRNTWSGGFVDLHAIFVLVMRVAGLAAAVFAIMQNRSSQGAVAWVVGLISYPYVALPLYLVFGFSRFRGYVRARRIDDDYLRQALTQLRHQVPTLTDSRGNLAMTSVFTKLAGMPYTAGNRLALLIDGEATYDAIEAAIDGAQHSVLVQFYIIRDDLVGQRLFAALTRAAQRHVLACLLYDSIGSNDLDQACIETLRD